MPIKKELKGFYPIDWRELSRVIRFERAGGRCERCGRPHGQVSLIWAMAAGLTLRLNAGGTGRGRVATWVDFSDFKGRLRRTHVILATAHLDHDPTNNRASNLKALCQHCHLLHDRWEHRRRRRLTCRRRWALGDLLEGPSAMVGGRTQEPETAEREALPGLVERLTFHNEENAFCVLQVKARGHRDLVTVVGHATKISPGEFVQANGVWVNDRKHGPQFKAQYLRGRADHRRRDQEISRLRHDQRHRSGLWRQTGAVLRRGCVRSDRNKPGPASGGSGH